MLRQGVLCSTLTWTTGAQVKAFSHWQWAAGHRLRLVRVMTGATMVYRGIILCWNSLTQKSTLTAKLLLNAVSRLNVEHRNTVSYKSLCTDFTQTIITARELSQLHWPSLCETYCEIHRNRMTYTSKVILAPHPGFNIHISVSFIQQKITILHW